MRSIYKYDIAKTKDYIIEGPIIKLLTAQAQHNSIVIWAEIDTTAPNRRFQIIPVGTGWPLDAPAGKKSVLDTHTYISTIQLADGNLVFHIYGAEIISNPVKDKKPENKNAKKTKVNTYNNKEVTFAVDNCAIDPEILQKFLH